MKISHHRRKVWLSASDTYRFAAGAYGTGRWPCSELSGHRVFIEFDSRGDLVDYYGPPDVSNSELMACISANLTKRGKQTRAALAKATGTQ